MAVREDQREAFATRPLGDASDEARQQLRLEQTPSRVLLRGRELYLAHEKSSEAVRALVTAGE